MFLLFPMVLTLVLAVPTWSESILFLQSGDGVDTEEMVIMDTDGGNVLRVQSGELATQFYQHYEKDWSPDGKRRAVVERRGGELNIYITAVDGSADKNVTNHNAWYSEVTWSPDGDRIAFVSDREASPPGDIDVFILELDDSNLIRIQGKLGADANPAWSWDGERLAFSGILPEERRNNHEIYVVDKWGQNLVNITQHPAEDIHPSWSPDGSRIAFVSVRDEHMEAGFAGMDIFIMNSDGSNVVRLTNDARENYRPIWLMADVPTVVKTMVWGELKHILPP